METYTIDNSLERNKHVEQIPENISLLPLKNAVLYPDVTMPIVISGAAVQLVEKALAERRMFGVVTQQSGDISEPKPKDLYAVGTVVRIIRMIRSPEGQVYVFVQGLARMKILEYLQEKPYYVVRIQALHDHVVADQELSAMFNSARNLFQEIAKLNPSISQEILMVAINIESPGMLADMLAEYPSLSVQERQELLETLDVKQRFHRIMQLLIREKEHLELAQQIRSQAQGEMEKGQREYYLRKQLEAIKKELGESDQEAGEIGELQKRIGEVRLPEEVKKTAEKELDRLSKMHPSSAEHTVSRTYLDWVLDLPWEESSEDNLNVAEAEHVLEEDHYGLEKVKKRILEYLAVRQLTHESKGPILCFVGPPGVGKTSLGKSIARALDRKFVRMSLGGIRDEAEIRGHRRTYIGALPGRIIQGLKKAGSNNPVFMLDEIDKVGADFRGDPASALLEVLDPEQNKEFSDHYLELPFDLSRVLFITTANTLMTIPPALLDRMEVIKISGYTEEEKVMIAKQYLVPRQLKAHGLISEQLAIDESALKTIIS
jgi:ATP-dependent Lon protease